MSAWENKESTTVEYNPDVVKEIGNGQSPARPISPLIF